jgi:ubiquinone/menaquinone biosynthesis C-methylase UbiE
MDIADYDSTNYNYEEYWQNRQYEHLAEVEALKKLLPTKGASLLDIGGGYGRNLKEIVKNYRHVTLLDYSTQNLDRAKSFLKSDLEKVTLVKGDAYKLPFPNESFETVLMIRVIHHLENPKIAIKEAYRVLKPQGIFVIEFANKCHFKALIRHGPSFYRDKSPHNQLTKNSGVFLNWHPETIQEYVHSAGFDVVGSLSVSNFRSRLLKRIVSPRLLANVDGILQRPLSKLNFGPSIFLKLVKRPSI